MTKPPRIVLGFLPNEFEASDANDVVALASAAMAMVAAAGNQDYATFRKAGLYAAETLARMPKPAAGNINAGAEELVDCLKAGKTFVPFARFKPPGAAGS